MARHEENREDLIAEATALVERIEFLCESISDTDDVVITAGFRRNDFLSIYFGQDRFYQFDLEGCLRRAYVSPFVYRAQFGNLCRLDRQRSDERTTLVRTNLAELEAVEFMTECRSWLQRILSDVNTGRCRILRFVVEDENTSDQALLARVTTALTGVLQRDDGYFSKTIAKGRMKK